MRDVRDTTSAIDTTTVSEALETTGTWTSPVTSDS